MFELIGVIFFWLMVGVAGLAGLYALLLKDCPKAADAIRRGTKSGVLKLIRRYMK